MQWNKREPIVPGCTRIVRKFAWTPVLCSGGIWTWFEFYYEDQIFERWSVFESINGVVMQDVDHEGWKTTGTFARPRT